ncbi:MAG TPA: methyltransferase domain-containing protein [Parachlamydiaceae bacterium]|nr:methyltransferase domain-containing protein [Parachlamydiaceae bacterium]
MIVRLLLLLLITHTSQHLHAESSYWDAGLVKSYVHHSDLQRRWAMSFLAPHLKSLNGNEEILDIGCGDGKITADISKFVPAGSIVGIDISTSMINWAQKQYHKNEYPNLTFKTGSFLESKQGPFDLIISFCALQHCTDQQAVLSKVGQDLKSNGKLLILVPLMNNNEAWNQARSIVQKSPEWKEYWKNFSPRKFLTPQSYVELLAQSNLKAISVEAVNTVDPFVNKDEILDWLEGTFPPLVPKERVREFYSQWIEEYIKLDPSAISIEGVIYAKLGYICIEATLE